MGGGGWGGGWGGGFAWPIEFEPAVTSMHPGDESLTTKEMTK